jgi:hypothetical protein
LQKLGGRKYNGSILLLFRLDINNLAEYKSSAFIYKFIFGKPGRTQQLFPHFGKPYRWLKWH